MPLLPGPICPPLRPVPFKVGRDLALLLLAYDIYHTSYLHTSTYVLQPSHLPLQESLEVIPRCTLPDGIALSCDSDSASLASTMLPISTAFRRCRLVGPFPSWQFPFSYPHSAYGVQAQYLSQLWRSSCHDPSYLMLSSNEKG